MQKEQKGYAERGKEGKVVGQGLYSSLISSAQFQSTCFFGENRCWLELSELSWYRGQLPSVYPISISSLFLSTQIFLRKNHSFSLMSMTFGCSLPWIPHHSFLPYCNFIIYKREAWELTAKAGREKTWHLRSHLLHPSISAWPVNDWARMLP